MDAEGPWWREGLPFKCTRCGKCCRARGPYQFVYVNREERRRLAAFLGMETAAFTRRYTRRVAGGYRSLRFENGACVFLRDNQCSVHPAKPDQCRTWPFWPELLADPETWRTEVLEFCPGSRRGPTVPAEEILACLRLEEGRRDS